MDPEPVEVSVRTISTGNNILTNHLNQVSGRSNGQTKSGKDDLPNQSNLTRFGQLFECSAPNCDYKSCSELLLNAHYKKKHLGIKSPFRCHRCCENFVFYKYLEEHQNKLGHGPVECDHCGASFLIQDDLDNHMKTYHGVEIMKLCEHCGIRLDSESAYYKHVQLHTAGFECEICHEHYGTKKELLRHRVIHGKKTEKCKNCFKTFVSRYYMRFHKCNGVVDVSAHKFQCEICGYRTAWQASFNIHKQIHTNIRSYSCNDCDYKAKTKSRLNEHRRHMHLQATHFPCKICGKTFRHQGYRLEHEKIHTEDENELFTCSICNNGFRSRRYLVSHCRRVHQIKGKIPTDPEQLQIAGKIAMENYKQEYNPALEEAKRTHVCHICGKAFKVRSHWVAHNKLHDAEKNLRKCPLCPKKFKLAKYVSDHISRRHKGHDPDMAFLVTDTGEPISAVRKEVPENATAPTETVQEQSSSTHFEPQQYMPTFSDNELMNL